MSGGAVASHINDQDQVDALKKWWKKYGNFMVTVIALCVFGIGGWHYWQARQLNQKTNATLQTQLMLSAVGKKQIANATAQANSIIKKYSNTSYATLASFYLAAQDVSNNKLNDAAVLLRKIIKSTGSKEFKAIATIRLAHVLLAQNKPKQVLALIPSRTKLLAVSYALVRGDAYAALNDNANAHEQYKKALAGLGKKNPIRSFVKLKISGLTQA